MANYSDIQPKWNETFKSWAHHEHGLKDVGCCYYRMGTNDIIPNHTDAYNVYTEKFGCKTEDVHKISFLDNESNNKSFWTNDVLLSK